MLLLLQSASYLVLKMFIVCQHKL